MVALHFSIRPLADPGTEVALLLLAVWFASPGVAVLRSIHGGRPGGAFAAVLMGPPIGYALSSVAILALWLGGVRGLAALLLAPAIAAAAAWMPARQLRGRFAPPALSARDVPALVVVLLLVPLVCGRPFARVGEVLPDNAGRAYRAYFTADVVWAAAVVAEVSKGDVLPHNMYRRGAPLHYYWLAHIFPAAEYQVFGARIGLFQLLLANALYAGSVFVAFLYIFARHFVAAPAAATAGVVTAVLCTSYEGLQQMYALYAAGKPMAVLRGINIDAVTRWFFQSLPVDGLQRVLFYQPQHQIGYAVGMSSLLVLAASADILAIDTMLVCGVLLGLSLLISTFAAIMIGTVVAVVLAVHAVAQHRFRDLVVGGVIAAVPVLAAVAVAWQLEYASPERALVEVRVNRAAVTHVWTALALSFGPFLAAVSAAAVLQWRAGRAGAFATLWWIVPVMAGFYFFVDVIDHQHVYVGWRVGHLLFIAGTAFSGFVVQQILASRGWRRVAGIGVAIVIAGLALPTAAIDLYNTQDVENQSRGPGFPWTLVITPPEQEALDWIKARTPPDAIVQVDPEIRNPSSWAYIPAFAERRMAAGIPISMVPLDRYVARSRMAASIYEVRTADEAYRVASTLRVDYLVVAPPEREAHQGIEERLAARPELFPVAFSNSQMRIYRVVRPRAIGGRSE